MTEVQLTSGGNDPAHNHPVQEMGTSLAVATTTTVESDSALTQDPSVAVSRFAQKMPQSELSDYLTRYTEIGNYTFNNTTPAFGVDGFGGLYPWAQFLANSFIAAKVSNFMLIKGTMEIMIVTAFPGNCFGMYEVVAEPLGHYDTNASTSIVTRVWNCRQFDHHATIDVSSSENIVLRLPFLWPYDYAQISTLAVAATQPWILKCFCLSTVKTAIPSGLTSGSVRVYARLAEDYELVVPSLQGKRKNSMAPDLGVSFDAASKVAGGKMKGVVSGIADKVSGVTSMLSKVPIIGPYASVATSIADTIGDVASMFGFTREDAETVPTMVTARAMSNPAHIDGQDTSEVAALTAANNLSIDPAINGVTSEEDCLSYASLFARWTLVKTFTWSSAATTSTIIGSIPVSPSYCNGTTSATDMTVDLTPAGYVGFPFMYWRGDMEYMIVIPVSKLHRGTLQVYWVPSGTTTTSTPTVAAMNAIYDVSSDQVKQFTVGFAQDRPYLENFIIPSSLAIIPTTTTNGRLVLMVVNPLQAQTASTVDVLVFARAGANMDFSVLNGQIPTYTNAGLNFQELNGDFLEYQGATGDDVEEEDVTALVASSGDYPANEILFGEKICSVRPLLQKLTFHKTSFNGFMAVPHVTPTPAAPGPFIFHNHYMRMFQGIAASVRIKTQAVADYRTTPIIAGARTVIKNVNNGYPRTANNHLTPPQVAVYGACEYKFPYYLNAKYIETRVTWAAGPTWPMEDCLEHLHATTGAGVGFKTWRAFGSDIRVTCFNAVPRLKLTYNSASAADFWS